MFYCCTSNNCLLPLSWHFRRHWFFLPVAVVTLKLIPMALWCCVFVELYSYSRCLLEDGFVHELVFLLGVTGLLYYWVYLLTVDCFTCGSVLESLVLVCLWWCCFFRFMINIPHNNVTFSHLREYKLLKYVS